MDRSGPSAEEQGAGRGHATAVWDPEVYLRYADERARPFYELVARVGAESPRTVVDLGCGEGALTASLAARWPEARITGIDSSPEMLAAAAAHTIPGRVEFAASDARDWRPEGQIDVLVTNALLHWVPDHGELLSRWVEALSSDGWLAVQVPGNFRSPTHTVLADLCRSPRWSEQLGDLAPRTDAVLEPVEYLDVLTGAGLSTDVWETTYLHVLTGEDPVLGWVRGSVLRPVLTTLDEQDAARLTEEYAAGLRAAYPRRPDGTTVLPYRRIFAVGSRRA